MSVPLPGGYLSAFSSPRIVSCQFLFLVSDRDCVLTMSSEMNEDEAGQDSFLDRAGKETAPSLSLPEFIYSRLELDRLQNQIN